MVVCFGVKFSSTLEESGGRARRTVGVTEGGSPRSEKKFGGFWMLAAGRGGSVRNLEAKMLPEEAAFSSPPESSK